MRKVHVHLKCQVLSQSVCLPNLNTKAHHQKRLETGQDKTPEKQAADRNSISNGNVCETSPSEANIKQTISAKSLANGADKSIPFVIKKVDRGLLVVTIPHSPQRLEEGYQCQELMDIYI